MGMLEREIRFGSWIRVTLNVAFSAGSSKHGNALRAFKGSNCVAAKNLGKIIDNNIALSE